MCTTRSLSVTHYLFIVTTLGLLATAPVHSAQSDPVNSDKATNVAVSYRPQESFQSVATPEKALKNSTTELVFSAPPRGSYEEEVAIYQAIVDLLSKAAAMVLSCNW